MNKQNKVTNEKSLTVKQKMLVAGVSTLIIGGVISIGWMVSNNSEELVEIETEDSVEAETESDTIDEYAPSEFETPEGDYVDEREELDDVTLEEVINQVYQYAYSGQWLNIMSYVEEYDLDYNLDTSEEGEHLRHLFLDANVLARLTSMGDTTDAVDMAVETLPTLNTEEMFVLGLYYLPRNVILELSMDTIALAPTQRGHVELTERSDIPMNHETFEGDEVLERYTTFGHYNEFEKGFTRFEVLNHTIEEYVYVVLNADDTFGLVGFYSNDDNPANTTQPVSHYKEFSDDVEKGIEQMLEEAQENLDDESETNGFESEENE